MADTRDSLSGLVDIARLTDWLDDNIPQLGNGPLKVAKVHGGTSNVILSLDRGGETMILRRPPEIPPPGSEKTVLREARVLTALNGTPVPHPVCHGSCADPGVIGAPFYVMEKIDGWAAEIHDEHIYHKAPFDQAPYEYGVPFAMVDGLIALANVDYQAVGLEGFGKPDNYLERQVDRWESQLRSYKDLYDYPGRDLPGYELTRDWLRNNIPDSFRAGIIHGDVGTPNALFADGPPCRLNALIDWELSTIGDPLLDLASFTNAMRTEAAPDELPRKGLYNARNWPTREEMVRYYAAGTGRDMADFDYYSILAHFKGGCILEYKVAQAAKGMMSKETGIFFSRLVLESFASAETLIRRIG